MAVNKNEMKDNRSSGFRGRNATLTPEKTAIRPPSLNGINKQLP
ncbi:hypothetical protein ACFPYJ_04880 [Paenibacillus solisilvae]|uniref:Uncharacterized protein n=1 Tax=Paenibacillus solisilvae TaxID=2486751 RepID=A0ABW0VT75_9BACL